MKRMTEFSFGLADSLLKLFFFVFPIGATSEKIAHPETKTEPEEIAHEEEADPIETDHPEEEVELEGVTHPEEASVTAEIAATEQETESDEIVHLDKGTALKEIVPSEMDAVPEDMDHLEEETVPEENPQPDTEEDTLFNQEPISDNMDDTEEEAALYEMTQTQEEATLAETSETEQDTVRRSSVKQHVFMEEYRNTELATGLIGSILGALLILLAFEIGVVGGTFQFNGTDIGDVMRVATPIFAMVALIGVILQVKYPKLGGCLVIIAVIQGFLATSFLYVPSGILLLISGYMGIRRGNHFRHM